MIIAFVGQKGGAGKSTLAIFTAAELTARGDRVLLVDADPQGTARTWGAVAAEEGHSAPTIIAMDAMMHRPGQLDRVSAGYDVVLIDCPPRHGDILKSALMTADVAVLPCGPSPAEAWALASSLELVADAQIYRPQLRATIALTRVRQGTRLAKAALEALAQTGVPILPTHLGYRVDYQEPLSVGQGVAAYAPGGRAAVEMNSFVDDLTHFCTGENHAEAQAHVRVA